jgi:hypothetical protein
MAAGSALPVWTSTSELTAKRRKRNHRATVIGANDSAPTVDPASSPLEGSVEGPYREFISGAGA